MLEFTGERFLPEVEGQIALEHLHRYFMASQLVRGMDVLDIASGEGYGSAILAQAAKTVVGVDISLEAIEHASTRYARADKLRYLVGDCAYIPLGDASFDAVVSFETIEHHDRHEEMMLEIKRVLRPGGLLIISSPDRYNYSIAPDYKNEYHVKELYRHEFEALLAQHFKDFRMLGQRVAYGSLLVPEGSGSFISYRGSGDAVEAAAGIAAPVYWIAVASDGALPEIAGGLYEQALTASAPMHELQRALAEREGQVAGLTHAVQARDVEVAELLDKAEDLRFQLRQVESDSVHLTDQLSSARIERNHLSAAHEESMRRVALLESEISDRDRKLLQILSSRSWRLTKGFRFLGRLFRGDWASALASLRRHFGAMKAGAYRRVAPTSASPIVPTAAAGSTPRKRILLVSYYAPSRSHAGGLRILDIYALIGRRAPDVELHLYTHRRPLIDWADDAINRIFDVVYWSPIEELSAAGLEALAGQIPHYDVIDLQYHHAALGIEGFRRHGRKILFTPMESLSRFLFLRVRSGYTAESRIKMRELAHSFREVAEEFSFCFRVDDVVCVSRSDAAFLRAITSLRSIRYIETGVSDIEFGDGAVASVELRPLENTRPVALYVAYFGSQTNVDALKWYLDEVHPTVARCVPGYHLMVVGRGDLAQFAAYAGDSVELVGEVDRLAPYITQARVGIAPALTGSGFRGKVNQYALFGVPSVISPIAAKGLAYRHDFDVLIAGAAKDFAEHCVSLLTNDAENRRIGGNARATCLKRYSWDSKWPSLSRLYDLADTR